MKILTKLRIESGDLCSADKIGDAYNLIGGIDLPEIDQKPFGRIRGNDFSMKDAELAVAIVHRRAGEMLEQASNASVFLDPKLQATWADGVRSAARLAVRQADQFMCDINEDLSNDG